MVALQDLRGVAADDPMRALQALPGVATGDDFQSQFSVRGSEFRHVDGSDGTATPLLLHMVRSTNDTGSIAMINSDVLDRASLMAGAHPQRQGDWLGATLDFGLREGSRDRVQVRGAASATTASIVLEGPLGGTRRGAWLTSIRKSYIDWLIRKLYPVDRRHARLFGSSVKARVRLDAATASAVRGHRGRCGLPERQCLGAQRHPSGGLKECAGIHAVAIHAPVVARLAARLIRR